MESLHPHNQNATDFILTWSGNDPRVTSNASNIGMAWMLVA
jgi:hypothetical protein